MAPKNHPMPLSGGDRKALTKEISKARAMTKIFAERSAEKRRLGEALIREEARRARILRACERKYPKLAAWQSRGARTVLVLEDNDHSKHGRSFGG